MFILNDPYKGAIHQPDMSIVAPIFYRGVQVAWAGACAHQLDTGGMSFGSWAYHATEVQQEAMLLPGLKIVEGGELRQDVWRLIMGMTRLPDVIGLDLKAMIAANNVAIRRFNELLGRYSQDTVLGVMKAELDISEVALRKRLSSLPDGSFRARDFIEHDGHSNKLYEICVAVHKEGDSLTFDMTGTSPQAPGFINCTYSGLKGALFAGLLPILAPDIRWNEGLMRVADINVPEACLCNAKWPAPVSGATVSAAWVVTNAVVAALSRMVGFSREWAKEGQAVTKGHMMVMTLAGRDRSGGPYGNFIMDALAGGGGAFVDHDGLDGSGDYVIPRPAIGNVESSEADGPLLYLFRGFLKDTAGAGTQRGGVTAGVAITPHDTDALHAMVIGHGVEVPNSVGLFGGMPGSCGYNLIADDKKNIKSILKSAYSPSELLRQSTKLGAKPGTLDLQAGQVLGYIFQGGGGYGDPLDRSPEAVADDVESGFVSESVAKQIYGVVLSKGAVNSSGTTKARGEIRRTRLGGKSPAGERPISSAHVPLSLGSNNVIDCRCGNHLAKPGEDWKASTVMRKIDPAECGPHIHLHEDLEMREFICPHCAGLREVEVMPKKGQPLATAVIA
jgi:N-methylhydantoinase B